MSWHVFFLACLLKIDAFWARSRRGSTKPRTSTRPILTSASLCSPLHCLKLTLFTQPVFWHAIVINGPHPLRLQERYGSPSHLASSLWLPQCSVLSTLTAERRRSSSHGLKVGGLSQSRFLHLLSSPSHTCQAFETVYNVLLKSHFFL